jgi:pimeloyl-ACP methyl ester carboxylesterase
VCLFLCLVPAIAAAQVTSGTSSAGIFYEVSGAGEPVVLIHAFSVDRRMWAPQIASLEKRFRVVRYDQRGHGKSDGPSAPYAQLAGARLVTIPRAAHIVNLDARDAFNQAVELFLSGR